VRVEVYFLGVQDETELSTDALNLTEPPRDLDRKRIDEFSITVDLADGRVFVVDGGAVQRFAQMTNWDYYESLLRFQKVLELSGDIPSVHTHENDRIIYMLQLN
jgi:GTP-binding protein